MNFIDLIHNLALLLALTVVSGFIDHRWRAGARGRVLQGVVFGIVAVIGMLNPLVYADGVIFDGRSVMLSLCAFFYGPLAGAIAMILTAICRVWQGGDGALTGLYVITASVALGLVFRYWRAHPEGGARLRELLGMGIAVHVAMVLLLWLTLPGGRGAEVIGVVGLPVLITYPLATILIGKVLSDMREREEMLEELAEGRERLRATLYSIGDAVITTDRDGRVRRMNPVAEQLTGWTEEEAIGQPLDEVFRIIGEEQREPRENPAAIVLREGHIVGLANHTLLIARDGKERPIADSGAPIMNSAGETIGVVLVFRDQSAERTAEEALRASELRFRSVFNQQFQFMAILSPEGRLLEINSLVTRVTGVPREQVIGRLFWDSPWWKPLPNVQADWPNRLRRAAQQDGPILITDQYSTGSGEIREADAAVVAVRDAAGAVEFFIVQATDVTERNRAISELRRSEALFRLALRDSPIVVFHQDAELRYTQIFNPHSGFSDLVVIGKSDRDLLPAEDAETLESVKRRAMETNSRCREEVTTTIGGVRYVYDLIVDPRHGPDGTVVGITGVSVDITEKKAAQERQSKLEADLLQAQKMEAVGKLAGGVAHDFNNMLGVILGHAELAMQSIEPSNPVREDLLEINRAGQRSADLTRQLLAFARKQTIMPRVLDVNEAVGTAVKMLRRLIGEDISLRWEPTTGLWRVLMDPAQLDLILTNLVVNARDAITGPGRIGIVAENVTLDEPTAEMDSALEPGDYVLLRVEDNGIGMDPHTLSQLFEPFFTTKEIGRGTGLGLATVYGMVRQSGGSIRVYSEVGRGSVFRIYLPRHEEEPAIDPQRVSPPPPARGTETVLLVEDEAPLLELSRRLLESLGYRVIAHSNPHEAIRAGEDLNQRIDLLLTDVIMPGASGHDVWKRLSPLRPGLRCLFVSGYTADAIADHGVLAKGVNFLQKPYRIADLARKVREALDS